MGNQRAFVQAMRQRDIQEQRQRWQAERGNGRPIVPKEAWTESDRAPEPVLVDAVPDALEAGLPGPPAPVPTPLPRRAPDTRGGVRPAARPSARPRGRPPELVVISGEILQTYMPQLTGLEFKVFVKYCLHRNKETGHAFLSMAELTRWTGASENRIRAARQRLETLTLLTPIEKVSKRRATTYVVRARCA